MKLEDIQIFCLRVSSQAMRGCDPLRKLTPEQVRSICRALREELEQLEAEAAADQVLAQEFQGKGVAS